MRLELTADQEAFRDAVRRFANQDVRPRAAQIDADDQFPRDLTTDRSKPSGRTARGRGFSTE